MITRLHNPIAALALLLAASFPAQSQTLLKPKSLGLPRTPDGHPDLQGTWNNSTLTPLQRRAEFAGKATLSDEEALAFENKDHRLFERGRKPDAGARPATANWIRGGKVETSESFWIPNPRAAR